jgi:hypothetical protein
MKKCPDKKLLFSLDDPELSIDDRVKLETHLQNCSKCRKAAAEVRAVEEEFKSRVATAFVPGIIKNAAMQQIRLSAKSASPKPIKRSFWFWILAPGIAVILFAALFSSKPVHRHNAALVNCHASSENSRVNNQAVEFGHQIRMQQLPMKLEGNFVFTMIATNTSSFEHSGVSDLVNASFEKLEFANASATFTLISGNQVQIIINGLNREIDICPIRVGNTVHPVQSNSDTVASHSLKTIDVASGPAELNPASSVAELETLASDATSVGEENIVAPASAEKPIVDETVNPFLDKPLILNGN